MKTMTKAEFKNFVMSGYFPTSNEDIADLQDVLGNQSMWYLVSLLVKEDTKDNAAALYQRLMSEKEYTAFVNRAEYMLSQIKTREEFLQKKEELEMELKSITDYIKTLDRRIDNIDKCAEE